MATRGHLATGPSQDVVATPHTTEQIYAVLASLCLLPCCAVEDVWDVFSLSLSFLTA